MENSMNMHEIFLSNLNTPFLIKQQLDSTRRYDIVRFIMYLSVSEY